MQILNKQGIGNRTQGTGARAHTLWLGVALSVSCFLFPVSSKAQNAQTLVLQMKQAEATISYSATQTGNGGTARVFRSGVKRRLEWQSPGVKRGDVLVDDGTSVYLYHRAEKSATKTDSRSRVPSFVPSGVAKSTTFAGRRAFSVPVAGNRTLIIDAEKKVLLAVRGGSGNGGFTLSDLKFGSVPASKFEFVAPSGVKVNSFDGALYANLNGAKRAARWLQAPANLPSGWSFESAIVGQSSAWLRFSNGQNRISLFEQPTTDSDLKPQDVDGGGGTFWKRGGVRFLATGSPQSALDEVVNQLK